jgi:hypothetical protein
MTEVPDEPPTVGGTRHESKPADPPLPPHLQDDGGWPEPDLEQPLEEEPPPEEEE